MIRLILSKGDPKGAAYTLEDGEHLLGRSHKCSVRLTAADVSREHAHLSVAGQKTTVENLSKYGTRLDGVAVEGKVEIRNGQSLSIGKQTTLKVDLALEVSAMTGGDLTMGGAVGGGGSGNEAVSVAGGPLSATRPPLTRGMSRTLETRGPAAIADAVSRKPTARGGHVQDDAPPSRGTWLQEPEEAYTGGGTRAQMTRGVPLEVIEEARREIQRREKRRVLLISVIPIVVLIVAAVIIRTVTPPPETTIEWPEDASGQLLRGYEPGQNGGRKDNQYDVIYPLTPDFKVNRAEDAITINGSLGRKRDIPMRITVREEVLDEVVTCQDGDTVLQQWIAKVSQSNDKWTFDKPLPKVLFLGEPLRENGIPFHFVSFECEHDGRKWFGAAYVFRHGRRLVATFVELPYSERARAEGLLFTYYIEPSAEFVRSYWEGDGAVLPASAEDSLSQIRQELRRQAPGTWANLRRRLFGVLQKAVMTRDARAEKDALELLTLLRKQEALWFNNQAIRIVIAKRDDDMGKVKQLATEAQGVFTSKDDWRFYECRRW